MKIEIINDNEIKVDDTSYFRYKDARDLTKNKFKDVFKCKNIEELFAFAGEDLEAFKTKHQNLTPKKLNLELIEKGIEIIRGNWKPTLSNAWYYPYFKRTGAGFSFSYVGYDGCFFCGSGFARFGKFKTSGACRKYLVTSI